MKKLKILNLASLIIALVLEILPFGVKMVWAGFFEEQVTYHSYFDLTVWGYGDMGPFLCAVLTCVAVIMLFISLFKNVQKPYMICVCAISLASTMLSVVPALFNSYTLMGLIITALLAASTELSIMQCIEKK